MECQSVVENNGKEKIKNRKIALLARSRLKSIEKIIAKALIYSDTSHEEFPLVINEEHTFIKLKESIRTKDIQLGKIERKRLIKHGKRIEIDIKNDIE